MKFQLMFRLGSIPVRIVPSFLLMTLFLGANHYSAALSAPGYAGWAQPEPASVIGWVAMALATVLVHELGHALVYRAFGHAPRILLSAWGGSTYCSSQKPTTIPRLMLAQLAGPAAALALAGSAQLAGAETLAGMSFAWGAVNLLPLHPLVGGQMVEQLLQQRIGAPRAAAAARWLSLPVAVGVAYLLVTWQFSLPGFCLMLFSLFLNVSHLWQARLGASDARFSAVLDEGFRVLREEDSVARAVEIAKQVLNEARAAAIRARAKELWAWAHLKEGRVGDAEAFLRQMPAGHELDAYLEGMLYLGLKEYRYAAILLDDALERRPHDEVAAQLAHALLHLERLDDAVALAARDCAGPHTFGQVMAPLFYAQRYAEAAAIGERWFALEKNAQVAFNMGCTLARLFRPDEAVSWLGRAVEAGWRDLAALDEDEDLAPLRKLPAFHQVRAQLTSLGRATTG